MTIYLSGPMTGVRFYRSKFAKAERKLSKEHTVINPVKIMDDLNFHRTTPEAMKYRKTMRVLLRSLLDSDGIVLLPGWESSKGAKIEKYVAEECGIKVLKLEEVV